MARICRRRSTTSRRPEQATTPAPVSTTAVAYGILGALAMKPTTPFPDRLHPHHQLPDDRRVIMTIAAAGADGGPQTVAVRPAHDQPGRQDGSSWPDRAAPGCRLGVGVRSSCRIPPRCSARRRSRGHGDEPRRRTPSCRQESLEQRLRTRAGDPAADRPASHPPHRKLSYVEATLTDATTLDYAAFAVGYHQPLAIRDLSASHDDSGTYLFAACPAARCLDTRLALYPDQFLTSTRRPTNYQIRSLSQSPKA